MNLKNIAEKIVVLGTGGTIAGVAASAQDDLGYTAGQLSVQALLDAIPGLASVLHGRMLVSEQVAQLDSKNMSFVVWTQLALRVQHHLSQSDVRGIIVTHGSDTLEETAYFLQEVLPAAQLAGKAVVLTCAMRPATSAIADGPQNVMDSVTVAVSEGSCGVLAVCAGVVHSARDVQKVHPSRLDAFSSGEACPLGYVEKGRLRMERNWPQPLANKSHNAIEKIASLAKWPRVEIVMNYVGASGAMVDALLHQGSVPGVEPVRGLVVAGTGNGTVHHDLEAALIRAQRAGVAVVRASRCIEGSVLPTPGNALPDSQGLSPVKARVAMLLALISPPVP